MDARGSPGIRVERLGRLPYSEAEARMLALVAERAAGGGEDAILLCEPDPGVLTVGRGARAEDYRHLGLPVVEVTRGGKATWHGPGQVVAWPVVRLEPGARDLHAWLRALEEALIRTVGDFGLPGGRDPRNTGCWVGGRKIASVGVAVRRWVAYHGVALNVAPDLAVFRRFDPCGLDPEVMTSMAEELGAPPPWAEVAGRLAVHLAAVLPGVGS